MDPKRDYSKGVIIIHNAIIAELERKGIHGTVSDHTQGSGPLVPDTIFTVVANGQTEEMKFNYEEIVDSVTNGIVTLARSKVRDLVSRFNA